MNEWREWWTVDGGFTSVSVTHWRAVSVDATDITPELLSGEPVPENLEASPVWLVWSERRLVDFAMWHFEGIQTDVCGTATYGTYREAHIEQLRRLGEYLEQSLRVVDTAQAALNEAREWKGHLCAPMPAIAHVGTFELTRAKTEIPR